MGLTLSTPKLNTALKYRQDELLTIAARSKFINKADTNDYTLLNEDDFKRLTMLIDGSPNSLIFHEKLKGQKPIIDTPIGIHILKLAFYSLLMVNTSNENLVELMNKQNVRSSYVLTQGFVLPEQLTAGLTQANFTIRQSIKDKDVLTLPADPYNVLGRDLSLIERKLKNLTKQVKSGGPVSIPKNKNLLQFWNYTFVDVDTTKESYTLKLKYKENTKFSDYFPYIRMFMSFINKYNTESYNQVLKAILELIHMDVRFMNLPKDQEIKAEQSRNEKVNANLSLSELERKLNEPIELIQSTTKSSRSTNLFEQVLYNVPPISINQASKYKSFSAFYKAFEKNEKIIDNQIGIIQMDMQKNYVNCIDEPKNNRNLVFSDINSRNLCKKYNESAVSTNFMQKIHGDTAKAFGDVLVLTLNNAKEIMARSFEFAKEIRSDPTTFRPTQQAVIEQEENPVLAE